MRSLELLSFFWSLTIILVVKIWNFDFGHLRYPLPSVIENIRGAKCISDAVLYWQDHNLAHISLQVAQVCPHPQVSTLSRRSDPQMLDRLEIGLDSNLKLSDPHWISVSVGENQDAVEHIFCSALWEENFCRRRKKKNEENQNQMRNRIFLRKNFNLIKAVLTDWRQVQTYISSLLSPCPSVSKRPVLS